jgi:hypothetical protein
MYRSIPETNVELFIQEAPWRIAGNQKGRTDDELLIKTLNDAL